MKTINNLLLCLSLFILGPVRAQLDSTKVYAYYGRSRINLDRYCVGDGITDDQTNYQKAINALYKMGGGWIVQNHLKKYKLDSAWIKLKDSSYTRLVLPDNQNGNNIFIGICSDNVQGVIASETAGYTQNDSNSVIFTTNRPTTGRYELIGGTGHNGSSIAFTNLTVSLQNITFQAPSHSSVGGANLDWVQQEFTNHYYFTVDSAVFLMKAAPNCPGQIGLSTPLNNNWAHCQISNTWIEGAYTGLQSSEHCVGDNVVCYLDKWGARCYRSYHAQYGLKIGIYFCNYNLVFTNITGGPSAALGTPSTIPFKGDLIDFEDDTATTNWWKNKVDIIDSANIAYGELTWHRVLSLVGVSTYINVYGCNNLYRTCLDNNVTIPSSTISATGTANYLAKFTGTHSLANSLFYDNGKFTGLGTSSPSNLFDVSIYPTTDSAGEGIQLTREYPSIGNRLMLFTQDAGHNGEADIYSVGGGSTTPIIKLGTTNSYFNITGGLGIGTSTSGNVVDVSIYPNNDAAGQGIQWTREYPSVGNRLGLLTQDGSHNGEADIYSVAGGSTAPQIKLNVTTSFINAQLGVGNTSPDASAILDASSTTQGFLPPRMTTTQRNSISSPAEGLMLYNLTTHKLDYYNGTTWIEL